MGQIYANSARTLVWLGLDYDGTASETVDFMKAMSTTAKQLCDKYGNVTDIPDLPDAENPVDQDVRKWELFENFINLPWFSRTWVRNLNA